MEEQDPTVEPPRASLSALSLVLKKDGRRRSLVSSNFIVSAAQTALVAGSRAVSKSTTSSVRRTTESVALTRSLLAAKRCNLCHRQFGHEVGKRRHCRRCGEVFCYECCSEKLHLSIYHSRWGVLKNRTSKALFVCKKCAAEVRASLPPEPAKAPRQRTMTEDELRQLAIDVGVADSSSGNATVDAVAREGEQHGRERAGSMLTRVRKTRARTLDRYMEAVKVTIGDGEGSDPVTARRSSLSAATSSETTPTKRHSTKHRRHNTLDDGFRFRLQAKQQAPPLEKSLHRAKELRDMFFDGVSRIDKEAAAAAAASPSPGNKASTTALPEPSILGVLSSDDLAQKPPQTIPSGTATVSTASTAGSWTGFFSNLFRFGGGSSAASVASSASSALAQADHEFDKAFEQEEKELEDALKMTQAQLREHEKHLKESEKQKEKARLEQVKKMTAKLLELQEGKIKEGVQRGQVVEKQMVQHAKNLEAHIKSGHIFDDTNEDDVVDLRDELRSVFLHLDELKVETVFPQCMRWKLRSKVEDGLFVGVRDLDIDKMDCSFSIKTSGVQNRVLLHMYQIQASVALYEFVIRGSSAKAKVLSHALAPTLNRVELHMTGEWFLPLIFQPGGTPEQPASRWVAEKEKAYHHLHIAKTAENAYILQLPDSFLQWLVDSLIPILIESVVIAALPTRDLGWFLCQSHNESLIRGKLQIHGDITPRIWKAPLIGPTLASIAARKALCVTEEEAAVLDFLLRSQLATVAGFPSNKTASLSMMHTWRLTYASHSLAALAPLLAVIESGSRMNIPSNWTLQLFRRIDELAAKPVNLEVQLFDVELDLDVKEMLTTITGLYLMSVEETVAKEIELEAARRAKRNRRQSETMYSPGCGPDDGPKPEDALRVAREGVVRIHKHFDKTLVPLLRDQVRTQFNAMLAGGSGGILAFSFTNFVADVVLPPKFQFSTLVWQSPEIYEGFILKVNGKNGPAEGEYTLRFNVLPAGEDVQDDDEDDDEDDSKAEPTSDEEDKREEDDAKTTLKNVKIELLPIGRPAGAVHVSADAWRSSLLLNSLIRGILALAATPQSLDDEASATEKDQRHDALVEERRVRRNSHAQTELTRELLIQSRQVVENLWGSFRLLPIVPEDDAKKDVIELAGGLDPLAVNFISDNAANPPDSDQYTQKLLMPYLTNDAFALHVDVRGLELALVKVKSSNGSSESMRLVLIKSMRHERDVQCVSFSMRRNLQDVFQADLLPI